MRAGVDLRRERRGVQEGTQGHRRRGHRGGQARAGGRRRHGRRLEI